LQAAAAAAGGSNFLEEILDEEAAQRRLGALMQLSAAQKRALEALASDRASLEAALGVAQRRFKAELDARRQAEAAAAATLSSLADERGKLDAARAAHSALLAGAEGATELGNKLEDLKVALQGAAHELVAQRALAEDAAHELDSCEGRVRWECALEREQMTALHAQQLADLERAVSRLRKELEHVTAQQAWELERMAAAADQTAGVAAHALSQADARKRDLEGVNEALASLSERLYVGTISIGTVTAAVDNATAAAVAHLVSAPHLDECGNMQGGGAASTAGNAPFAMMRTASVKRGAFGGGGGGGPLSACRSQPTLDSDLNGSSFDYDCEVGGDGMGSLGRRGASMQERGQALMWPRMSQTRKGTGGPGSTAGGGVNATGTMQRQQSPSKQRPGAGGGGDGGNAPARMSPLGTGGSGSSSTVRAASPSRGRMSPSKRWNTGTGTGVRAPRTRRRGRLPASMASS